jgi:hypothetical protein
MSPVSIALVLMFGLLAGQYAYADAPVQHPSWVIIATVIDRTTGERVQQSELQDSELEFDDPAKCKAIVAMVHPVQSGDFATVLNCRKVERAYSPGERSAGFRSMPGQQLLKAEP